MIKDSIDTPNSGRQDVLFKTLGIGDPNNAVPTQYDPAGGSLASDSNTVQNEVCEVCHTDPTKYYRNDDSHTQRDHHNVEDCTAACHTHACSWQSKGKGQAHRMFKQPASTSPGCDGLFRCQR